MKRYKIRQGSIADHAISFLGAAALMVMFALPSTIENLLGWC